MLKKVTIGLLIFSTLVLGKINDYRNVFSEDEKSKISVVVESFQEKTGNKLYLNTLEENEGFEAAEQGKTVIVNLIKNNENEILKIQLKISQDLAPEDMASDLSLLLKNVEEYTSEKNESLIAINLVEGLQEIFVVNFDSQENIKGFDRMTVKTKIFLGILLTFLVLSIRMVQVKRKKRKYKLKSDRY